MDVFDIYDELTDLIIFLDSDNNILALNKSARILFPKIEPIGKNFYDHYVENDFYEWKFTEKKQVRYLIGRKKISNQTETYLNSLLNASYQGLHIYWTDQENHLLLCNDTQIKNLGANSMAEVAGLALQELSLNNDPVIKEQICSISENNRQVMTKQQSIVFEETVGDHFFFSYKAPFYNSEGQLIGVLGISTDVTEFKLLQEKLKKTVHATDFYLESILMSSPSNIYWLDKEGRSIGCNDQQARCVGLNSRHDIIGTTVFDLAKRLGWDPRLAKQIRDHDLKVMETKQPSISMETVILDGEEKFYLASKSPMLDQNNEAVGILGISTDVTTQVQIEKKLEVAKQKAEAANKAKTQFITNITHDIRTPLVGIYGIANWLHERIPAQFDAEIKGLIHSSKELISLLNNVIELISLEKEEKDFTSEEVVNLPDLLQKLRALFVPIMQQKGLSFEIIYPQDIPSHFLTSRSLLEQIILNLLSNAFKFTESGYIKVQIMSNPEVTDTTKYPLLIMVEDSGMGIAKENINQIFESFFKLKPVFKTSYYSSGLGLAIVKKSLQKLNGKVRVDSELGKGSKFYISLPMTVAQEQGESFDIGEQSFNQASILHTPQKLAIAQSVNASKKIHSVLLVEDNFLIQKIAVSLLNKFNGQVDVADTAAKAIEFINKNQNFYDIIFLDIGLPDQDGFWVSNEIRTKYSNYQHTPIIALTAQLDKTHQDICFQHGIDDIITKPLTIENAMACLKRFNLYLENEVSA
ncbi:MAG: PAS domain-containing protein [Proteobacteria bacterium]|nr:PAS domain-containing protein [Pseudomonadota bacterium]